MSTYQGRDGVWVTYDYDGPPYVIKLYKDVVPASKDCATQGYAHVLFWPFGMEFKEAIDWWTENKKESLAESIVHFYYIESYDFAQPFCEASDKDEWIQIDHTANGRVCPKCIDKIEANS